MVEPPKKKQKRFATPADNEEMEKICQGYVPPNTRKLTNWALIVFEQWREERNADVVEEERIPFDLLECPQTEALNFWLSQFALEARRQDGKPYPGSTLLNLLSSLYCHSKSHDADCPNFMDRKSSQFKDLNGALTVKFRELRQYLSFQAIREHITNAILSLILTIKIELDHVHVQQSFIHSITSFIHGKTIYCEYCE